MCRRHNKFRGGLPRSLSSLKQLVQCDLSFNQFDGDAAREAAPERFSKLPRLRWLNLGHNAFLGTERAEKRLRAALPRCCAVKLHVEPRPKPKVFPKLPSPPTARAKKEEKAAATIKEAAAGRTTTPGLTPVEEGSLRLAADSNGGGGGDDGDGDGGDDDDDDGGEGDDGNADDGEGNEEEEEEEGNEGDY